MDTVEQIEKLKKVELLANNASESMHLDRRLGAFLLYAGLTDFMAIQAARLVEQIVLKGQLADGKEPTFHPHPDTYFYNHAISTRLIFRGIRKFLPFKPGSGGADEANRITTLANRMIDAGLMFSAHRNRIVHHIGSPAMTLESLVALIDQASAAYREFREAQKHLHEDCGPLPL